MLRKVLVLFYIVTLVFMRFWNVGNTARFTRDESYDIVKLHQYWKEKKITLVGAIDYTGYLVYSSLTYYTMMPFAVIGNFEPVSTVYAFSFAGVITVFFIYLIAKLVNKEKLWLILLLALFWFPLLQASRWSWNPYFLPFSLSIAFYLFLRGTGLFSGGLSVPKKKFERRGKLFLFFSGIFFGAAFHYHYISFITSGSFLILYTIYDYLKRRKFLVVWTWAGLVSMIIPFVIFDLRHPPGLFFTGYLKSNMVSQGFSGELGRLIISLPQIIFKMALFLSGVKLVTIIVILAISAVLISDIKSKNLIAEILFLPLILQLLVISFLPTFETRYFLPALIPLLIWLLIKRKGVIDLVTKSIIFLLILGNLFVVNKTLFTTAKPSPKVVGNVANYIAGKIEEEDLKNVNIAVLSSPDPDPLGAVYRDVLLSKEIRLLPTSEYDISDSLFVVSTSSESIVRNDPANVINGFRDGPLDESYLLRNSEWRVYLFKRY